MLALIDYDKEFTKIFDSICGVHSRWQVWNDFINLAAYDISNAVDSIHREKRTQSREFTAKKYKHNDMDCFAELFSITVSALEHNAEQDFLGSLYMNLNLGNKNAGQFFTPYSVCDCMGAMTDQSKSLNSAIDKKGWAAVHDPCIGGGAMLIALANHCKKHNINYQQKILFVGQDLDATVAKSAYIQLSLIGAAGYIVIGDSLAEPLISPNGSPLFAPTSREIYITPMYFSDIWKGRRLAYRMDKILR